MAQTERRLLATLKRWHGVAYFVPPAVACPLAEPTWLRVVGTLALVGAACLMGYTIGWLASHEEAQAFAARVALSSRDGGEADG